MHPLPSLMHYYNAFWSLNLHLSNIHLFTLGSHKSQDEFSAAWAHVRAGTSSSRHSGSWRTKMPLFATTLPTTMQDCCSSTRSVFQTPSPYRNFVNMSLESLVKRKAQFTGGSLVQSTAKPSYHLPALTFLKLQRHEDMPTNWGRNKM